MTEAGTGGIAPLPHDPAELFAAYLPPLDGGFVLRLGMVSTIGGQAADEQNWTASLGGAGDLRVLRVLRASADAVLVGAGTVRLGKYRPIRTAPDFRDARAALTSTPHARLVVVSRSLQLDWNAPPFDQPGDVTVLAIGPATQREHRVPSRVEVHWVDAETAHEGRAIARALRDELGVGRVICEGGPTLASSLLDARVVDQLCVTLAPTVVSGEPPMLLGPLAARRDFQLQTAFAEDSSLFLSYAVAESA